MVTTIKEMKNSIVQPIKAPIKIFFDSESFLRNSDTNFVINRVLSIPKGEKINKPIINEVNHSSKNWGAKPKLTQVKKKVIEPTRVNSIKNIGRKVLFFASFNFMSCKFENLRPLKH